MKFGVQNHLRGQIVYRLRDHLKKRRRNNFFQHFLTKVFSVRHFPEKLTKLSNFVNFRIRHKTND